MADLPHEATIADFTDRVRHKRPQDLANFNRVVEKALPALAARNDLPFDPDDAADRQALIEIAPANWLLDCVTEVGGMYEAWLIEAVPELLLTRAYAREYLGAFNRCLKHGVMAHVLSTAVKGVAPEWLADRQVLHDNVPINEENRRALIARGMTHYHGKDLVTQAEAAKLWARKHVDCFNGLARFMTARGIARRADMPQDALYGAEDSYYAALGAKNATARYYCARDAWAYMSELLPEVPAVSWPEPGRERQYGIAPEERSPVFQRMVAGIRKAIEDVGEESSADLAERAMSLYAGYLKQEVRIDEAMVADELGDARDLAVFLLGPSPTPEDGRVPDPAVELARLRDDPGYRKQMVDWSARNIRHAWSREAPRANVLLRGFLDWLIATGRTGSAKIYVNPFVAICTHYLEAAEAQIQWLVSQRRRTRRKHKDAPPGPRMRTKIRISRAEDLWLKLVENRGLLEKWTDKLRAKMLARPGHGPTARAWARAQRDKVSFKLLLAYPMRADTFPEMRVGEHILLDTWQIHVLPGQTKGNTEIYRTIRDTGVFGELREDIRLYREEAVPLLLDGRPLTPYFLVTEKRGRQVFDKQGDLMAGAQAFARIIRRVSRTIFREFLPEGVDELWPHLFRDLFSHFVIDAGGGLDIVVKALANTPGVVSEHYASRVHKHDKDVHEFVDDRLASRQADQGLCKKVEAIVRIPVSPEQVRKLRRLLARQR